MYRALYLALLCSGDSHPDIALYYVSLRFIVVRFNVIFFYKFTCTLPQAHSNLFLILILGDHAFHVAAVQTWNSLPASLTSLSSLASFRRQLKTELIARRFPDSDSSAAVCI